MAAILFPFIWQHVYVPILPAALSHFLDAPVPFLMGIFCASAEDKENLALPSEVHYLVSFPESLIVFPPPSCPGRWEDERPWELGCTCCNFGLAQSNTCIIISNGSCYFELQGDIGNLMLCARLISYFKACIKTCFIHNF